MANNGTLVARPHEIASRAVVTSGSIVLASHGRAEARAVRFVTQVAPGEEVALSFVEPFPCAAVLDAADIDKLDVDGGGAPSIDGFTVCLVPSGAATSHEDQLRIDRWVETADVGTRPVIDLLIRGDRIRWRAGRCVIQGAPDRFSELLQAVTSFAFYEGRLRKLEADIDSMWPTAERDVVLTRKLDGRALRRWAHVDGITERLTRYRIEYARIEPHLEKPPLALSLAAQRAISELAVQCDVEDRLVYLDDRLEVFEDLYEWATDRLTDYSYFRREFTIELAIVIALLLQVGVELLYIFK